MGMDCGIFMKIQKGLSSKTNPTLGEAIPVPIVRHTYICMYIIRVYTLWLQISEEELSQLQTESWENPVFDNMDQLMDERFPLTVIVMPTCSYDYSTA